jgi:predicted phage gp36 major capsid-like protein
VSGDERIVRVLRDHNYDAVDYICSCQRGHDDAPATGVIEHRAHVAAALAAAGVGVVADAKAEALREAADDVPLFEFMLVMDIAAEVAPAQIAGWIRARAARVESEAGR